MGNEKPRRPLSSDPRILHFGPIQDWEDGVGNERDAKLYFDALQSKLEGLGVAIPTDAKILEIGSGNNIFLQYLQKLGFDAVGVDARPRGEKTENVVGARIEQLPFPDETFGFVISNSVFDLGVYRQDQLAMVKEVARVLRHGGIYLATLNWDKETLFREHLEALSESSSRIGSSVYRKK
ncbi:MAG: class I SAM-dependent methyltransferase [bacterium]|nr:class I SAM-dependent methyltransferase [bacterium]